MIAAADSGAYGYDVGCVQCCVWLLDVLCEDDGGGDGSCDIGKRRRHIGVLGACSADDAGIISLQDHRCCDGC